MRNNESKANAYWLLKSTTPEALEMKMLHSNGALLTFDDRVLVAGYSYATNGQCYYGAIYHFTSMDHTCEGQIELVSISEETFKDNGHAIAWAMAH